VHIGQTPMRVLFAVATLALLLATLWRWGWRVAVSSALVVIVAIVVAFPLLKPGHKGIVEDRIHWQPLSEQAITAALADNKRVFIDVTADWCVTCKANKYNELLRDDVQQALTAPDIVALRGDWSRPSDTISQFLRARQSVAVPFNQIYGPGLAQGRVLPPLLSRDDVLQTLTDAKGK
jgi:suppressor for copper-sensitivity B